MKLRLLNDEKPKRSNKEIKARIKHENAMTVGDDKLVASDVLTDQARFIFDFLVSETKPIGLYTNLDYPALLRYAMLFQQYNDCFKQIQEDGIIVEANKSSESVITSHPLFKTMANLGEQMRKLENDLGLNPSARAKIALHKATGELEEEKGEFDDL